MRLLVSDQRGETFFCVQQRSRLSISAPLPTIMCTLVFSDVELTAVEGLFLKVKLARLDVYAHVEHLLEATITTTKRIAEVMGRSVSVCVNPANPRFSTERTVSMGATNVNLRGEQGRKFSSDLKGRTLVHVLYWPLSQPDTFLFLKQRFVKWGLVSEKCVKRPLKELLKEQLWFVCFLKRGCLWTD